MVYAIRQEQAQEQTYAFWSARFSGDWEKQEREETRRNYAKIDATIRAKGYRSKSAPRPPGPPTP
ncbi:hypothetical protein ASF71_06880 [Deinococcus sp. Leaf326]|nr:hypothetical protein ASF71_06880 [Deinococcus sp. Leaf326]